MPSYMSFRHTVPQVLAETKTVTRRLGWRKLKPGQRFWAAPQVQGLKKGQKVTRLKLCECVSNTPTILWDIAEWPDDLAKEGFPDMTPAQFIRMFCCINKKCRKETVVSRIEYKYVKE